MANAIITIKIMPENPEVNLDEVQEKALAEIKAYAGEGDTRVEIEPVAFGLKAVKILFVIDESKGSPDPLEEKLREIPGVQSAETVDVRRAIG